MSALITKILREKENKKILAIDADPAVGFATLWAFRSERPWMRGKQYLLLEFHNLYD